MIMNSSIRFSLIVLISVLSCGFVSAQSQFTKYDELPGITKSYKPSYSENYPEWAKMLYSNSINVNEIDRGYKAYIAQHPEEKNPLTRYYKIWRRAVDSYVQDDGTIIPPDLDQYRKNLHDAQKNASANLKSGSGDNSNWSFLGPKQTFWLNSSGAQQAPGSCPWQVNVYSFDVAASDNNIIFAGSETGYVNKSIDNGLSWQISGQNYPFGGGVTAVAIHPDNPDIVYVSAGKNIHKTTDGGINWTPMLESSQLFGATRLIIDYSQPDKLIAAANEGLYISTDGGVQWERRWTKATWDVEIKPDDSDVIYGICSASGSEFSLAISTDGGVTFASDENFPADHTNHSGGLMAVTPANPDIVFVTMLVAEGGDQFAYIYKGTHDEGAWTWQLTKKGEPRSTAGLGGFSTGQGYFDYVLAVSPVNEDIVFWGTCTLFKSTDGGFNFSPVGGYGGDFSIHPDIQDIKMLPNGKTWVATDGGMNLSSDNFVASSNYSVHVDGLIGSDMWGFDQGWNEDLVVGGRYHNGNTAMADFYNDKALRMGGAEAPTGWVIKGKSRHAAFSDIGSGWILPKTAEGEPEGRFIFSKYPNMEEYGGRRGNIVAHPNYYGVIYLGEGNSIWKSSDMGVSFESIYTFSGQVRYMQISFSHPDILYADVVGRGLYKSEDGGYTWSMKRSLTRSPNGTSSWTGKLFFAISPFDGNKIYACLSNGTWSSDIGKVFMSEDGGDTWTNWTGSIQEYTKNVVVQPTEDGKDLLYLFTNAKNGKPAKVYYRTAEMDDWADFSRDYPAGMDVNLALPFFRDSKMRVGGNGGVWESTLQEPNFKPIVNPWVERPNYNCMLDTIHFDDHSILNHEGASWEWDISPEPTFISDVNIRNPKVVLGAPGSYSVTLTVTVGGGEYSKTIPDMVTTTTCPSVSDCNNPAVVPIDAWRLVYVDSEEKNYPGLGVMAIDGDPSTIWHTSWSAGTDPYPHDIMVDMGERYSIHRFTYLPRQDGVNGRIKKWEFYIGDDVNDWGHAIVAGEWENNAAPKTVELPETRSGRYWRLKAISEVNGGAWASAAEISVTGCNGNTSGVDISGLDENIRAYPIPTDGWVKLDIPSGNEYRYKVLSSLGQSIEDGVIQSNTQDPAINLGSYEAGVYLIRLTNTSGNSYWVKVVRE